MSQLDNTLREAADRNNELLSELSATDFAPSSLKQNTSYISDLKSQIATTDKELARLHQITEDEKKVRGLGTRTFQWLPRINFLGRIMSNTVTAT